MIIKLVPYNKEQLVGSLSESSRSGSCSRIIKRVDWKIAGF